MRFPSTNLHRLRGKTAYGSSAGGGCVPFEHSAPPQFARIRIFGMATALRPILDTFTALVAVLLAPRRAVPPATCMVSEPATAPRATQTSRRLLQLSVLVAATVPVTAGTWFAFDPQSGGFALLASSHARYLSGLLLAIGVAFWTTLPRIEAKRQRFGLLTALVVTGGLCRLVGVALGDPLSAPTVAALVMELAVTPLLWAWQRSLDRTFTAFKSAATAATSPRAPAAPSRR
jgi:hypothetical protein